MSKKIKDNKTDIDVLIKKTVSGDSDSFTEISKKYAPLIDKCVLSFKSQYTVLQDLEDLRQEALIALYNAILHFDQNQTNVQFGAYAKVCIINRLTTKIVSLNKSNSSDVIPISTTGGEEDNFIELSDDDDLSPEEYYISKEKVTILTKKIESLLSAKENNIWRYYLDGDSVKAIASKLGGNEKSIENAIFRIRKKIKTLLT